MHFGSLLPNRICVPTSGITLSSASISRRLASWQIKHELQSHPRSIEMPTWQVANYRLYYPSGHPDEHTLALVQLFDSTITNVVEIVFSTAQPLPPNTN